jgi:hypothetical protein
MPQLLGYLYGQDETRRLIYIDYGVYNNLSEGLPRSELGVLV